MEAMPRASTTRTALPAVLIAAVIQGLSLYALQHAIEIHVWPATDLAWLIGLYGVALFAPVTFELAVEHAAKGMLWALLAVLSAAVLYFGWHQGSAVADLGSRRFDSAGEYFPLLFVLVVWWLQVLPFLQNRLVVGQWTLDYRLLFTHAWRNIIALAEAAVFSGLLWLILWLWMSLFHMLGIDFFRHLFTKTTFVYPVTSIAFGCALYLIGSIDRLVSTVLEQILNVLKWLAPVTGVLLAIFTVALLVKLPGLVATGSRAIGAVWLLWLVAVVVLFLNAAFRDGTVEHPYPHWMAQALRFCVPLTVIVALTAVYALLVRTAHYGVTVERVWAYIVAGAAVMYSVGYGSAAVGKGRWLRRIARVNVAVALALIAVVGAAFTPLLSPYRLAADSQFARILEGNYTAGAPLGRGITAFQYLGFHSGRYGRRRLQALMRLRGRPDAEHIRELARHALAERYPWQIVAVRDPKAWVAKLPIYPAGRMLDPDLARLLVEARGKSTTEMYGIPNSDADVAGVFVDLKGDGTDEFVLLAAGGGPVYGHLASGWHYIGRVSPVGRASSWPALLPELTRGDVSAVTRRWKDLSVGTQRFRVDAAR